MYLIAHSFAGSSTTSRWRSMRGRLWARASRTQTTWGSPSTPSSTGSSTSTTTETTTLRWEYETAKVLQSTSEVPHPRHFHYFISIFPSSSVTFNPAKAANSGLINHEAMAVTTQVGFITVSAKGHFLIWCLASLPPLPPVSGKITSRPRISIIRRPPRDQYSAPSPATLH